MFCLTYFARKFNFIESLFASHPKYVYPTIPATVKNPIKTFHKESVRALGLNFEIAIVDTTTPIAQNTRVTVPVTRLDTEADCLY